MEMSRRTVVTGLSLSASAALAPAPGALTFPAADGAWVSGDIWGSGRHAVVLVPGAHGIGETWQLQAERLAGAGLRVLTMDYRGLGDATDTVQDSDKAHLDVLGAIARLKADGAERISLVGASWGGRAAALAALEDPGSIERIAMIAHSPFDNPGRLGGRKLFVVAREDRDGTGNLRRESIQLQYELAPEPKRLVLLDGAAHAQFLFLTRQGERLYAEIERFLTEP